MPLLSPRTARRTADEVAARARLAGLRSARGWVPTVPEEASGRPPSAGSPLDSGAVGEEARQVGVWRAWWRDRVPVALQALAARTRLRGGHAAVLALVAAAGIVAALLLARAASPEVLLAPPAPDQDGRAAAVATSTTTGPSATGPATAASPSQGPGGPAGAGPAAPSSAPTTTGTTATQVVVHVAGRVRVPGVRRLPAGSRVVDAVRASGGALPGTDLATLNLARVLVDGEQVAVGLAPSEAAPVTLPLPSGGATTGGGADGGSGGGTAAAGPVDLNTATLEQLDALPGVGPVLGQRILDWRAEHGRFTSVEELGEVTGIGEAKLADLRDRVVV